MAIWLTPNGNASLPVSATNNPNLQYELIYYTGSARTESQITHRTFDTIFDTSGSYVRDLGRPIVVVDNSNRVLVVTRSEDTGKGNHRHRFGAVVERVYFQLRLRHTQFPDLGCGQHHRGCSGWERNMGSFINEFL